MDIVSHKHRGAVDRARAGNARQRKAAAGGGKIKNRYVISARATEAEEDHIANGQWGAGVRGCHHEQSKQNLNLDLFHILFLYYGLVSSG
jgi:hypothetical protein